MGIDLHKKRKIDRAVEQVESAVSLLRLEVGKDIFPSDVSDSAVLQVSAMNLVSGLSIINSHINIFKSAFSRLDASVDRLQRDRRGPLSGVTSYGKGPSPGITSFGGKDKGEKRD